MSKQTPSPSERRSFLTRLNTGAASVAALALGSVALAQSNAAPAGPWQPARHDKDDWMDAIPGKHRMVIDTTSPDGFRDGVLYAGNFLLANLNDYGLQNQEIAVIVVARHTSTGYGFNDAMWAKYGATLADPGSKETPKANPSAAALARLAQQGVQFAVCSMATNRIAGMIARASGGTAADIFKELTTNTVSNAHMVSAGIVAVSRAQEKSYTFVRA